MYSMFRSHFQHSRTLRSHASWYPGLSFALHMSGKSRVPVLKHWVVLHRYYCKGAQRWSMSPTHSPVRVEMSSQQWHIGDGSNPSPLTSPWAAF